MDQSNIWTSLKQKCIKQNIELEYKERNLQDKLKGIESLCDCDANINVINNKCDISSYPSTQCLKPEEIDYMKKVTELCSREKEMQKEINQLEQREKTYRQILQEFEQTATQKNGLSSEVENELKKELEQINKYLKQENCQLRYDLDDLKLEFKQTLEKLEGPMHHQLQREKIKCDKLEEQLRLAYLSMKNSQECFLREMNSMKTQLESACADMLDLSSTNQKLKRQLCELDCKYSAMEDELVQQKIQEAETINRIKSSLERKQSKLPQTGAGEGEGEDNDEDLHMIARKLSQALKNIVPCKKCTKVQPDLVDTAQGLKGIVDMVHGKVGMKPGKKDCLCQSSIPDDSGCQCDIPEKVNCDVNTGAAVEQRGISVESVRQCGCQTENNVPIQIGTAIKVSSKLSVTFSGENIDSGADIVKSSDDVSSRSGKTASKKSLKVSSGDSGKISSKTSSKLSIEDSAATITARSSSKSKITKDSEAVLSSKTSSKISKNLTESASTVSPKTSSKSRQSSKSQSKGSVIQSDTSLQVSATTKSSSKSSRQTQSTKEISKTSVDFPKGYEISHEFISEDTKKIKSSTSIKHLGKDVSLKEFPFDVETKVDIIDKPPDGVHVITTITGSGTLEVVTEGPTGVIETTLTYTESGKIEVVTELVNYEDHTPKSQTHPLPELPSNLAGNLDISEVTVKTSSIAGKAKPSEVSLKYENRSKSESRTVNMNESVAVYTEGGQQEESLKVTDGIIESGQPDLNEDVSASLPVSSQEELKSDQLVTAQTSLDEVTFDDALTTEDGLTTEEDELGIAKGLEHYSIDEDQKSDVYEAVLQTDGSNAEIIAEAEEAIASAEHIVTSSSIIAPLEYTEQFEELPHTEHEYEDKNFESFKTFPEAEKTFDEPLVPSEFLEEPSQAADNFFEGDASYKKSPVEETAKSQSLKVESENIIPIPEKASDLRQEDVAEPIIEEAVPKVSEELEIEYTDVEKETTGSREDISPRVESEAAIQPLETLQSTENNISEVKVEPEEIERTDISSTEYPESVESADKFIAGAVDVEPAVSEAKDISLPDDSIAQPEKTILSVPEKIEIKEDIPPPEADEPIEILEDIPPPGITLIEYEVQLEQIEIGEDIPPPMREDFEIQQDIPVSLALSATASTHSTNEIRQDFTVTMASSVLISEKPPSKEDKLKSVSEFKEYISDVMDKTNKEVMQALEDVNKDVIRTLSQANKDVEEALAVVKTPSLDKILEEEQSIVTVDITKAKENDHPKIALVAETKVEEYFSVSSGPSTAKLDVAEPEEFSEQQDISKQEVQEHIQEEPSEDSYSAIGAQKVEDLSERDISEEKLGSTPSSENTVEKELSVFTGPPTAKLDVAEPEKLSEQQDISKQKVQEYIQEESSEDSYSAIGAQKVEDLFERDISEEKLGSTPSSENKVEKELSVSTGPPTAKLDVAEPQSEIKEEIPAESTQKLEELTMSLEIEEQFKIEPEELSEQQDILRQEVQAHIQEEPTEDSYSELGAQKVEDLFERDISEEKLGSTPSSKKIEMPPASDKTNSLSNQSLTKVEDVKDEILSDTDSKKQENEKVETTSDTDSKEYKMPEKESIEFAKVAIEKGDKDSNNGSKSSKRSRSIRSRSSKGSDRGDQSSKGTKGSKSQEQQHSKETPTGNRPSSEPQEGRSYNLPKCDCIGVCKCLICAPEIMYSRGKLGVDRYQDNTLQKTCDCKFQFSSDTTKDSATVPKNLIDQFIECVCFECISHGKVGAPHPADCSCLECLCRPKPPTEKKHPKATDHSPDCSCLKCICKPCRKTPKRESVKQPTTHGANCLCPSCLCKPTCKHKSKYSSKPELNNQETVIKQKPKEMEKQLIHGSDCECIDCLFKTCTNIKCANPLDQACNVFELKNIIPKSLQDILDRFVSCKCDDTKTNMVSKLEDIKQNEDDQYGPFKYPRVCTCTICSCETCLQQADNMRDATLIDHADADTKSNTNAFGVYKENGDNNNVLKPTDHAEECDCPKCICQECDLSFIVTCKATSDSDDVLKSVFYRSRQIEQVNQGDLPTTTPDETRLQNASEDANKDADKEDQNQDVRVENINEIIVEKKVIDEIDQNEVVTTSIDETGLEKVDESVENEKTRSEKISEGAIKEEISAPVSMQLEVQRDINSGIDETIIDPLPLTEIGVTHADSDIATEMIVGSIDKPIVDKISEQSKSPIELRTATNHSPLCDCEKCECQKCMQETRNVTNLASGLVHGKCSPCDCLNCSCEKCKQLRSSEIVEERKLEKKVYTKISNEDSSKTYKSSYGGENPIILHSTSCNCIACICDDCRRNYGNHNNKPSQLPCTCENCICDKCKQLIPKCKCLKNVTRNNKLQSTNIEDSNQRQADLTEIMRALNQIRCACTEAEIQAAMGAKTSNYENTLIGLQTALIHANQKLATKNQPFGLCNPEQQFKAERSSEESLLRPRISTKCIIDVTAMEITDIRRISSDALLIKWSSAKNSLVSGYHIIINGECVSKVLSAKRTNALLSSLNFKENLNIEVYAVTKFGRCQPPALACFKKKK